VTGAPVGEAETKIGLATTWVVLVMLEVTDQNLLLLAKSYFMVANPGIIRIFVEAPARRPQRSWISLSYSSWHAL